MEEMTITNSVDVNNARSNGEKTLIVMVGLPACGKSTIAQDIKKAEPLRCSLFNAGQRRRQLVQERASLCANYFFNMQNLDCVRDRDQIAMETLNDLLNWMRLDQNHAIGIFDATNSTQQRRKLILEFLMHSKLRLKVIFLEVIIESENILEENIYGKLTKSPDYKTNPDKQWCYLDFRYRLHQYKTVYETIAHSEFEILPKAFPVSIIKVVDRFEIVEITGSTVPTSLLSILFSLRCQYHQPIHKPVLCANHINFCKRRNAQLTHTSLTSFPSKSYGLNSSP